MSTHASAASPSPTSLPRPNLVPDPSAQSPSSPSVPSILTVEDALISCIRAWLVVRDTLIWNLNVSGVGGEDDFRLIDVELDSSKPEVAQMNALRASALYFAAKLASKRRSPEMVLDEFLTRTLSSSRPALSLRVDSEPDSF